MRARIEIAARLALAVVLLGAHGARVTRAAQPVPVHETASRMPARERGSAPDSGLAFTRFFSELASLSPDSSQVASVASLEIERDAGVFVLEQGTLALCKPVAGHVVAAVFSGRGVFACAPPSEIERDQLQRFYGTRSMRRAFHSLVLLFSDTTLVELRSLARFAPGAVPAALRAAIQDAAPYFSNPATRSVPIWIAKPLLDPVPGGLFYAHMNGPAGPLFFTLDPSYVERVQLMRRPDDDHYGMITYHDHEIVNQFRVRGDTDTTVGDFHHPIRVTHYELDTTFRPGLDVRIVATLDVKAESDDQRWLPLQLFFDVTVDSLCWDDGRAVNGWGWKDNPTLWVRCDPPLSAGETRRLRMRYHGRILDREGDVFFNEAYAGWYPRIDGEAPASYGMTFHCPSQYEVVAAGRNEWTTIAKGVANSRWVVDPPSPSASFDIGLYHTFEITEDSLPPIRVLLADPRNSGRHDRMTRTELAKVSSQAAQVAAEIADECAFFRHVFGPLPDRTLNAVETTDRVLVAYPQLVHLPLHLPSCVDPDLAPHFFRAHEVAHQWWGIGVDTRTYHDAWLSEGFADFAAALYVQSGRPGSEGYLSILRAWRKRIFENRRYLFGRTTPAAPVSLGDRTNSSRTAGDYSVIVYNKGAWVLHMLRNLMLDEQDPGERRFLGLMRDLYAAHAGGFVTNADVEAATSRAMGRDMHWFFDQWIDHAELPTYTFSWHAQRDTSGRYVVRARVAQSNVPANFRMEVPVRVEYGRDRVERMRVAIAGAVTEFELPPADAPPTRVVLNDLESVLCEVIPAPWK
ncbi:MAG: hypothetical protein HYR73_00410 [Candidatus Eisenbacteria bacterium]|nr:hypothetical protein [Candidatus Eisenbacteria bacterium]